MTILDGIRKADDIVLPETNDGRSKRVLLTSVFGPYAVNDDYGSRVVNPMELYHNQVTRMQGAFSLRMFHRSWGLMLIQANIEAPCTLLDFPDLERFIAEIQNNRYDVVGISSIQPNVGKVAKMCKLIRAHLPSAEIVVGGHISNIPDLAGRIDADHIVRGEGISWFRQYLGEDTNRPIVHPAILSGFGTRAMGMTIDDAPGEVAAVIIPSVGCPMGCNFCSTSAMFGGKGKFFTFFETGDELFEIMTRIGDELQTESFFMMDENFLFHKKRALRLLELMEEHGKAWSLYVFTSARVLKSYEPDQLVRLGISWVWMGIEGENSEYDKLDGVDTFELVNELRKNGIRVLGSTILGFDHHTHENIDGIIEHGVRHRTDFHQFMLITPMSGTPLFDELVARGLMKDETEVNVADIHGQYIFRHRHPHIKDGTETELVTRAFTRDFFVNGPSLVRIAETTLLGWLRHKNHPDPRVRDRMRREARHLPVQYSAAIWAARRIFRNIPALKEKFSAILDDIRREFGLRAWLAGKVFGRYVLQKIRKEETRLAAGWVYEPPTFYEFNPAALAEAAART